MEAPTLFSQILDQPPAILYWVYWLMAINTASILFVLHRVESALDLGRLASQRHAHHALSIRPIRLRSPSRSRPHRRLDPSFGLPLPASESF